MVDDTKMTKSKEETSVGMTGFDNHPLLRDNVHKE